MQPVQRMHVARHMLSFVTLRYLLPAVHAETAVQAGTGPACSTTPADCMPAAAGRTPSQSAVSMSTPFEGGQPYRNDRQGCVAQMHLMPDLVIFFIPHCSWHAASCSAE